MPFSESFALLLSERRDPDPLFEGPARLPQGDGEAVDRHSSLATASTLIHELSEMTASRAA